MTTSEAVQVGMVLTSIKHSWLPNFLVTSLTGPTGSDKSITVREITGDQQDKDLIINRRSLGRFSIVN